MIYDVQMGRENVKMAPRARTSISLYLRLYSGFRTLLIRIEIEKDTTLFRPNIVLLENIS